MNEKQAQEPYPGLRPFEFHERHLFHGRDRDARRLRDQTLTSPLLLFFGLSGLGKSSLLRARVVGELAEAGQVRTLYHDEWSDPDPLATLKGALARLIEEDLGLANAASGAPTLTELALLAAADNRPVAIVLDQFEELLTGRGTGLDGLYRELATLVRSTDIDAHVVLSLREESLAQLEPLRADIPNLFESTFRLMPLGDEEVRLAIVEPARSCGGVVQPELVQRLLADEELRDDVLGAPIALPMLQLVCQQLWRTAAGNGSPELTPELLDSIGGTATIIERFVKAALPGQRSARARLAVEILARVAPASGLKQWVSAKDIKEQARIAEVEPIEKELDRMADAGLLRTRSHAAGKLYAVYHDALIPRLRSWLNRAKVNLDRHLRRAENYRLRIAVLLTVGSAVGGMTAVLSALLITIGVFDGNPDTLDTAAALAVWGGFHGIAACVMWWSGRAAFKRSSSTRVLMGAVAALYLSCAGFNPCGGPVYLIIGLAVLFMHLRLRISGARRHRARR